MEIVKNENLTPIEIALGVDENKMTTAKKLYEFLQLNPVNYSRWCKKNIVENEFAEENVDYWAFFLNEECGGQATTDYKLTAKFAKKLSMQQKNERGERARDYFNDVEEKAVDMVKILKELENDPMKVLQLHYEAIKQVDKKVETVSKSVGKVANEVDDVKDELKTLKDNLLVAYGEADKLKRLINMKAVKLLGGKQAEAYQNASIRGKLYADIHRQIKRNFDISSYKMLKNNDIDKAVKVIEDYTPPLYLADQIEMENRQIRLEVVR